MILITAAWGSCFVAIDWGLRDAPVLWFAALRSLLAGAVLIGVALSTRWPATVTPVWVSSMAATSTRRSA